MHFCIYQACACAHVIFIWAICRLHAIHTQTHTPRMRHYELMFSRAHTNQPTKKITSISKIEMHSNRTLCKVIDDAAARAANFRCDSALFSHVFARSSDCVRVCVCALVCMRHSTCLLATNTASFMAFSYSNMGSADNRRAVDTVLWSITNWKQLTNMFHVLYEFVCNFLQFARQYKQRKSNGAIAIDFPFCGASFSSKGNMEIWSEATLCVELSKKFIWQIVDMLRN